jgi:transposase
MYLQARLMNHQPKNKLDQLLSLMDHNYMAKYIHRRNIKYKNEISYADKSKILGVAIDPSKHFYRVIIFNFLGKLICQAFSVDTFSEGFNKLVKKIRAAEKRLEAVKVFIAIENAGLYSDNLVSHLKIQFDNVVLIHATSVASNREQKSLHGLKTDDIDCGAIADLLIRGEFPPPYNENSLYYQLRNFVYWREKKLDLKSAVINQIQSRLDKIYPGLNSGYSGRRKLFNRGTRDTLFTGLVESNMPPHQLIEMTDEAIFNLFGYCRNSPWKKRIRRFKQRLDEMLLPDEKFSKIDLELLKRDVGILRVLEKEIIEVEQIIINLGKQTPAKYIMGKIKGISDLYASMFIGVIGDLKRYKTAGHIYSKSGLCPKTEQSGSSTNFSKGIKRAGSAVLRSILFKMTSQCILCEPVFKEYYNRLRKEKKRHWLKDRIAMCRKINNVLFALMRDKTEFRRQATGSPT